MSSFRGMKLTRKYDEDELFTSDFSSIDFGKPANFLLFLNFVFFSQLFLFIFACFALFFFSRLK